MAYLRRVYASVVTLDRSRLRGWSAVRRAVVVMAALIAAGILVSPQAGGIAGVAALYVGLQDRAADPRRYTLKVMSTETVLLAALIVAAGLVPGPGFVAVVLVLFAALSGLTARRDAAVSRMFADVLVVEAFLGLSNIGLADAWRTALAVLLAGATQTALTWASSPLVTDLPERRPIAAAMLAVADHLDDAIARDRKGTGEASEAALTQAEGMLSRCDLSHERRRAMRSLITTTEALRDEGSAVRTRQAFDVTPLADDEVAQALSLASSILRICAAALNAQVVSVEQIPLVGSVVTRENLSDLIAQARAVAKNPEQPPAARAICKRAAKLGARTQALRAMGAPSTRTEIESMTTRVGLRPSEFSTADVRSALRLGLAAVLGLAIAAFADIPHGAWIVATAVGLLRPDHRAMTTDTLARALGTALGALLVVPLVAVTADRLLAELIVIAVLATAVFMVTSANEGLFIVAMTIFVVFTQAAVGEDPIAVATARVVAVLIGCALAVVLLALVPLRQSRRLRPDLAEYARATARWLDGVSAEAEHQKFAHPKKRRRQMRRARDTAQHHLDIRSIEPLGRGLPSWLGHSLFHGIHDTERAATAAESALTLGDEGGPTGAELGAQAAAELRMVADLLMKAPVDTGTTPESELASTSTQTPVEELLLLAYQEAYSTRRTAETKLRWRNS